MPETIIYKLDLLNDTVIKLKGKTHRASRELEDFDTRMKQQLYKMECEEGSRFQIPEYTKTELGNVWGRL